MNNGLAFTVIVPALVLAAGGGLLALLGKPPRLPHLVGLTVLEATLVVYAVVAFGRIFTGDRPEALATFVGYLLTAVLLPVLAALLGYSEKSKWGSVIVGAAGLVVALLVVRLQQVWGVW